jgi:thymidylate kinase
MGKIIEFTGMPAAGKSTQVRLLTEELKRLGKTVTLFNEKEIKFEEVENNFYEFNRRTYLNLVERYKKWEKNPTDFLILDRGFYDRLVWPLSDFEMKYCSKYEKDELLQLVEKHERPFVDYIFFMMILPEISLKRKIKPETSIDYYVMRKDYLDILYRYYKQLKKTTLPLNTIEIEGNFSIINIKNKIFNSIFT